MGHLFSPFPTTNWSLPTSITTSIPTSPVSCPNPFHHSLYPCNLLSDILFLWFIEAVIIPLKFNSNLFIVFFFCVYIQKNKAALGRKLHTVSTYPKKLVSGREARAARASYMDKHTWPLSELKVQYSHQRPTGSG